MTEQTGPVPRPTRRQWLGVLAGTTAALAGCSNGGTTTSQTASKTGPSETATPDDDGFSDRVESILDGMSVQKQAGQTVLHAARQQDPGAVARTIRTHSVGGVLYGGARTPAPTDPERVASILNAFQRTARNHSSENVPVVAGIDAVHGNATVQPAAVFPHNVGLGATYDRDLAERVGEVTARSMRATGFQWAFAPVADLLYDPRWGRFYEGLSQDPLVTSKLVDGLVTGLQSETPAGPSAATVKHFAGYSLPDSGDDRANADISRRRLRERVLPPYRAGIDAGAETVMVNSGSVNGVPGHASEWLLQTVLRNRWGFDGLVVSDWLDIWKLSGAYGYVSTYADAVQVAINAGVDMTMAPRDVGRYVRTLTDLVESGGVSESRLRSAAGRVLQLKERLGLFESPTVEAGAASDRVVQSGDRDLALETARKSMTVLQTGDAFPIESGESILVTGPNANSVAAQCGGWTIGWQGMTDVQPSATTVLDGIEAIAPSGASVTHVPTGRASLDNREAVRSAAEDADRVVAVLGEGAYAEGQGDIDSLSLPSGQRALVETLSETGTPTTGVLIAGRPRGSPTLFENLDGFVMAYYPGSEGGQAVAETLFGENPHEGALPFTWPTSVGDGVASDHDHVGVGETGPNPQFQFGAGRGETTIRGVDPESISRYGSTSVTVNVHVSNELDHAVTIPVVVRGRGVGWGSTERDPVTTAASRVVGFDRAAVEANGSTTISVPLDLAALGAVRGDVVGDGDRVLASGTYALTTGQSQSRLSVSETAPIE